MSYRTPSGRVSAEGKRQIARMRAFAETFLTFAGESELCGQPYEISEWLAKNIWNPLFGTGSIDKKTKRWRRRFRRALIGVHRGFGKSQLAAVLVLTIATMEALPNGIYGIVADTKDNTKMVRDYIVTIIRANSALSDQWSIYKDVIRNDLTGQEIHVYPYKEAALQGKHFHVLIGDEIHVWKDDSVWKAGTSGQAKIWNAITIGITTAGASRDGYLFKLYHKLKHDKHAFICWLGITDSDDPSDRRVWKKITAAGRVTMEELEEQYESDKLEVHPRQVVRSLLPEPNTDGGRGRAVHEAPGRRTLPRERPENRLLAVVHLCPGRRCARRYPSPRGLPAPGR